MLSSSMECSHDCFNCPFPDCVLDDSSVELSISEIQDQDRRDREAEKELPVEERKKHRENSRYRDDPLYRKAIIARAREWYRENRDRANARRREHYRKNAEKIRAQQRKWRAEHQDELNARAREKRAEKRRAEMLEWGGPVYRDMVEERSRMIEYQNESYT